MNYTRAKWNTYLAQAMKQPDITPQHRTEELCIPKDKALPDMDAVWLKRNLCHAAQGNVNNCRECPAPCMIGKALQRSVVV